MHRKPAAPEKYSLPSVRAAVLPCESARYRICAANGRSVCPPQGIRQVPQPGQGEQAFAPGPRERTPCQSSMQRFERRQKEWRSRLQSMGADPLAPAARNRLIWPRHVIDGQLWGTPTRDRNGQLTNALQLPARRPSTRELYRTWAHGPAMRGFHPDNPRIAGPAVVS